MRTKDVIPGVFSRHAGAYRDRLEHALARGEARGRSRLLELLQVGAGERVLDLGCGPGTLTLPLGQATGPAGLVVGVDLAEGMLGLAAAAAPGWVRLARMDMEGLALRDGAFDVVACGHALQFCPELTQALREACRVLRPGGRLAASVPGAGTDDVVGEVLSALVPAGPPLPDAEATRALLRDPDRAAAVLEDAGFEAVGVAVVEEVTRHSGPEELVAGAFGWWNLAWRLEAVAGPDRERLYDEALRRLRSRLGDGPLELRGATTVMCGRRPMEAAP